MEDERMNITIIGAVLIVAVIVSAILLIRFLGDLGEKHQAQGGPQLPTR